jgi:hypothetical protein
LQPLAFYLPMNHQILDAFSCKAGPDRRSLEARMCVDGVWSGLACRGAFLAAGEQPGISLAKTAGRSFLEDIFRDDAR